MNKFSRISAISITAVAWVAVGMSLDLSRAHAMGAAPPHPAAANEAKPDLNPSLPSQELLKGIFESSTQELQQISALMSSGKFGDAMLLAKKIVDRVSVINPKGNYITHIPVSDVLSDADLEKPFISLLDRQQEALAKATTAFRGGYFLDILNLYKRAKLAYVQAFYRQMRNQLMQVDIDMMRQSLIDVYAISILLADDKASDSYLLFDSDIANPDEQYMFNRELISTATSIPELHLSESAFNQAVKSDLERRLSAHKSGLLKPVPKAKNICHCRAFFAGSEPWGALEGQTGMLGTFSDRSSCVSAERLYVENGTCSGGADL